MSVMHDHTYTTNATARFVVCWCKLGCVQKLQGSFIKVMECCSAGDGLGFLWPYLAGYPKTKVAIVDLACIMEPLPSPDHNMTDTTVCLMYPALDEIAT